MTNALDPSIELESRNAQSRQWWDRACQVIVGGGQLHKRPHKYMLRGGPAFAQRAKGARFWDVDGNEYLDYLLSYGPIVLGHADPEVNEAVLRQMNEGTLFSIEHPATVELVESLCELIPCADMAFMLLGGSSATHAAIRCARAHTRREVIIRCGYHGWLDWCFPTDPGAPQYEQALVQSVPYNDLPALAQMLAKHAGKVAAVIIEAVQDDGPEAGYFAGVRRLCDEHETIFVLDEVKTGIRFGLGGAQARYKIDCDLATFGKALCNGYPGSVLVGKRCYMEARTDTWIAATFHGDLLSVAAANTVLRVMRERDGVAHLERLGTRLIDGLNEVFLTERYPLRMAGLAPMPTPVQTSLDDPLNPTPPDFAGKVITEWCAAMQRRGFYVTGHCWFLSLAHSDQDIEQTISAGAEAAREALALLKQIATGQVDPLPYR